MMPGAARVFISILATSVGAVCGCLLGFAIATPGAPIWRMLLFSGDDFYFALRVGGWVGLIGGLLVSTVAVESPRWKRAVCVGATALTFLTGIYFYFWAIVTAAV
jgi:hypothetical protein